MDQQRPMTRKERLTIKVASLVESIPKPPDNIDDSAAVRKFLHDCFGATCGATELFEKLNFGQDLDDSLYDLISLLNFSAEAVLAGSVVRVETLASVRDHLYSFFCTLQQRVDCVKG